MAYGWAPPRVGVGADWSEDDYATPVWGGVRRFGDFVAGRRPDETDEERRRRERYAWNPPQRLEEQWRHTQQNPLTLPADLVGLAGEAFGNAAQYPLGVAAGLGQTLQGGDPGGPAWLHTNQPRNLQDVVEPAKALEREAEIPTAIRLPSELAVGMAVPSMLGRAARPVAQGARRALGAATGWETAQPLLLPTWAGAAAQAGRALESPAVQVGLRAGVPAAAGVTAALEGSPDQPWHERALRGGAYALGAALATNGLASVVGRAGHGLDAADALTQLVITPEARTFLEQANLADRIAAGGAGATPVQVPGGYARMIYNGARGMFTDEAAALQTLSQWGGKQVAGGVPLEANPYLYDALIAGQTPAAHRFVVRELALGILGKDVAQEQLTSFERLRAAGSALERAQEGLATGTLKDLPMARTNYLDIAQAVDRQWGEGMAERWYGFDRQIPDHWQPLAESTVRRMSQATTDFVLPRLQEAGLLSDLDVETIRATRPTHVARRVVESLRQGGMLDVLERQARPRLAQGPGVQEWYSTEQLERVGLDQDFSRISHLLGLAARAEAGNAYARLADTLGEPYRQVFGWALPRTPGPKVAAEQGAKKAARTAFEEMEGLEPGTTRESQQAYRQQQRIAIETGTQAGADLTEQLRQMQARLPAGWKAAPLKWENGTPTAYAVPAYLESYWSGGNQAQADLLTGFARQLMQAPRSLMTAMSLPFLIANPIRHLMQGLRQNAALANEGPAGVYMRYSGAWADLLADGSVDAMASRNPLVAGVARRIEEGIPNAFANAHANLDEFHYAGGAGATIVEGWARNLHGPDRLQSIKELLPRLQSTPVDWTRDGISMIVKGPVDLMKGFAFVGDTATRLAVFNAERAAGAPTALAAFRARRAPFDYAKGGTLIKLINQWIPFVNVHTQAVSQTLSSAWDDPDGYMMRSAVTTMLPFLATYAWNEAAFPGLQQKLPQWKRDAMFNLIVSKYTNPQGEELPITLSLKKDEGAMLMTNPVEYLLDALYHTKRGKTELSPDQRHSESAQEMWLNELLHLQPFAVDAAQLTRAPLTAVPMAFLTGNPVIGTLAQMHTNYDQFRNSPITPPSQMDLPPEYRAGDRTSSTMRGVAQFMKAANVPVQVREQLSPTNLDFMSAAMGGWIGTVAPHVVDQWWDRLAQAGLAPDPSLYGRPMSVEDLGLPKDTPQGVVDEYLARIPPLENGQPWWSRLGILVSTAGSAETTRARVEHSLSPEMRRQSEETTAFWRGYEREQSTSRDRMQAILAEPDKWTHDQIREKLHDETKVLRAAREALHGQFPHAILDRRERQAFEAALPGLGPLHPEDLNGPLPEGFDIAAFSQQYQAAPGGEAGGLELAKARARFLQQTSQQTGVSRTALLDAMAAQVLGSAPSLILPDLALEEGVDRFLHPPGVDPTTAAPRVMNKAREEQVQALAQEWQVTPQEVQTRIRGRLSRPGLFSPLETSEKRAELVRDKLAALPKLVNAQGQTIDASPEEMAQIDARIAALQKKRTPREAWPALVRQYDSARHNAKVLEISTLAEEPYAADYEAWYGIGRNQTIGAWNDYQSGQVPRYKGGTPADWARWDLQIRLYRALPPDSPRRQRMAPQVRQLEQRQTAGWAHLMQADTED